MRIDRCAITLCLRHRRPRNQSAQIAPMHVARGIVVRIKKISVLRNLGAISRHPNFFRMKVSKNQRRVREMPFRRAHVRHRLHDAIFRLQACAQCAGEISDLMKTSKQAFNTRLSLDEVGSFGRDLIGSGFS